MPIKSRPKKIGYGVYCFNIAPFPCLLFWCQTEADAEKKRDKLNERFSGLRLEINHSSQKRKGWRDFTFDELESSPELAHHRIPKEQRKKRSKKSVGAAEAQEATSLGAE